MICPNDAAEMHQVKIMSHYGQQIILDQCDKCGGIWFDESELFRAKQGEAEKVEPLNVENLRSPSVVDNRLVCPRDRAKLFRFTDTHFPDSIILVRCPSCHGIWLNRGEFTKYQRARQGLQRPKADSSADKELEERIVEVTDPYQTGGTTAVLGRLGSFLSTDLDSSASLPLDSPQRSAAAGNTAGVAIGILVTILRALLRI